MATYKRPDVFINEVIPKSAPIEGVATAVAGVVGAFKKGKAGESTLVTSWDDFVLKFGGIAKHPSGEVYMSSYAVYDWFNNGGGYLYIARIVDGGTSANATLDDDNSVDSIKISAYSEGAWGNKIGYKIVSSSRISTQLTSATASGDEFIEVGSVEGIVAGMVLLIGTVYKAVEGVDYVNKRVLLTGTVGTVIASETSVESKDFNIEVYDNGSLVEEFKYIAYGGKVESGESATDNKGVYSVENMVNDNSAYIEVEDLTSSTQWVTANQPQPADVSVVTKLTGGGEGTAPSAFTAGNFATTYLPYLDVADNATIILAPDAYVQSDNDNIAIINNAISAYCEGRKDAFGVVTFGETIDTTSEAVTEAGKLFGNSYAEATYPWVEVSTATGKLNTPPVGMIAGLIARTDANEGVSTAPAGTNATLRGINKTIVQISNTDNELLRDARINPIRFFTGVGYVHWGTLTLSSDSAWKYIPVRRLMIKLEESIQKGIRWSVFKTNNASLWAKLRLNITSYLMNEFRAGNLAGGSPSEAFYVKCNGSNNPQAEIDAGRVHVEVGIAPNKPAEFVVVTMGLWDGGSSITES